MIILDTNVVSALMQRDPDAAAVSWLDRQPAESIWITSVTVFEVLFGLELLPAGQRRRRLEDSFTEALSSEFEGRVLPLDQSAAREAAIIAAKQRRSGRPIEFRDAQIAGIAAASRATLATRNMRHFDGLGITVLNPWRD